MAADVAHLWPIALLFLPLPEIQGVCTLWRLRNQHVHDAGRRIQQVQKALIPMNATAHCPE
jgi:hypothetical protein